MKALLSPRYASFCHGILCQRKIYDDLDMHTRSLVRFDINMDHYGPMLVPILLNKLPESFEIEILRHMPAGKLKLAHLLSVFERFSRINQTF